MPDPVGKTKQQPFSLSSDTSMLHLIYQMFMSVQVCMHVCVWLRDLSLYQEWYWWWWWWGGGG